MRVVLSVLFFLVQGLMAEVQEVRSYRVENLAEHRFFEREVDLEAEEIPLEEWLGAVVTKAPFASRFLKDVTEMRDFTPSLAAMFAQKFTGKAVYDPKSGRLVVQTIPREHSMLQQVLKWRGPVMIQTEVSVYRSPGVVTENRTLFPDEELVGAELLGNVGGLHLLGQGFEVRTPEGNLELKGEGQADLNDHTVELGLKLNSALPLGKFRLDTRLWLSAGKPLRYEVGSLDGESSVFFIIQSDLVLTDGTLLDEWILKEEGGAFLREEREAAAAQVAKGEVPEDGMRRFVVPPTFFRFLVQQREGWEEDPFATDDPSSRLEMPDYVGDAPELAIFSTVALYDCKKFLQQNGVAFREGDFAVWDESKNVLLVKLEAKNMEMLEGIVGFHGPPEIRQIQVEFFEVEKDSDKPWKLDEAKVLRKIVLVVLPGQTGTMVLGDDLAVEVEAQIDGNDQFVDMRAVLTESGGDFTKAVFKTGMVLEDGRAIVVQKSAVNGKDRAWMVRASVEIVPIMR